MNSALLREKLHVPGPDRLHWLFEAAFGRGMSREEVCSLTKIDPWFIRQLEEMLAVDSEMAKTSLRNCTRELMLESKRSGASDEEIAKLWNVKSSSVRARAGTNWAWSLSSSAWISVRGGIRVLHSLHVFHVRGRRRVRRGGPPENRDPGQRAESHRPGN